MVTGYNDLVDGYSRKYIMYQFRKFTKLAINLNKEVQTDIPNSVDIAGLYYPPQLTWYPDNPNPPPNHVNKIRLAQWQD